MNVLLVQNLPVPFDRRVWNEATALHQSGRRVAVICPSDEKHPHGRFNISGIDVIRYRTPREGNSVAGYAREYARALVAQSMILVRLILTTGVSSVHYCNPPDLLFLVAAPAKLFGAKLIFDQHDLGPELMSAKKLGHEKLLVGFSKLIERMSYALADKVISTNESYREIAVLRGRKDPSDVVIVRSAPSIRWADKAEPNEAWRYGRDRMIGYLGVMGRQEGIEYLLDAFLEVRKQLSTSVALVLVGGGPDKARLEEYAKSIGIADDVFFTGRVDDDVLREILATADVCVNPDEVNEMNNLSTMNKIIEYMALGRPIVQFDVKEGRYSAQESSLYACANDSTDFARCVVRVLSDQARADLMGVNGRRRFESELSWESQVPRLIELYDGLLFHEDGGRASR